MNTLHFLNALLPLAYAGAAIVYGRTFFAEARPHERRHSPVLLVLLAFHACVLGLRWTALDHPPATTVFEILTLLAFTTTAAYVVIERRTGMQETGFFILVIAFAFQTVSSLFMNDVREVPTLLRSGLFGFHVTAALAGYSAISLSAVYGALYLMLYHQVKQSRFGVFYRKLPSLENLQRMSVLAIWLGFVFLAVAITVGILWLPRAFNDPSYADPKLIGTVIIWCLYGVALIARRSVRWKGRKMMVVAISGFVVSVFSMTAINMLFTGFHRFF